MPSINPSNPGAAPYFLFNLDRSGPCTTGGHLNSKATAWKQLQTIQEDKGVRGNTPQQEKLRRSAPNRIGTLQTAARYAVPNRENRQRPT